MQGRDAHPQLHRERPIVSRRILGPRNFGVLVVLAALGTATGVFAWWHAGGAGTASASLATLGNPAPVHASSPATGEADVDWTAVSSPSGVASDVTYTVERSTDGSIWHAVSSGGSNTCSGSLSQ